MDRPLRRDVVLMVLAFAALRIYAVAGLDPVRYADSASYFEFDLLGDAPRLWVVPLLYTIFPTDEWRVVAHVAIAIGCWATLAAVVASLPANVWVARAGAAGVLALGLTRNVTQWDMAMLAESLAVSLSVLVVAALLLVARRRTRATLVFLAVAVTLWAFTRHINLVLVLLVLPVVAVALVWRVHRTRAIALGAVVLVLGAWGALTISREDNVWRLNSYAILTNRILPHPDRTEYFTERGLKVKPAMRQGILNARGPGAPGFVDPDTQQFLRERWRGAYVGWLLRNPGYLLAEPWKSSGALSTDPNAADPRTVMPPQLQTVLFSETTGRVAVVLVLVGALWLAAWWRPRDATAVDAAAAGLVAVSLVGFMLVWHTATELARPAAPLAVMLRAGLFVLVLLAVGRLVSRPRWLTSSAPSRRATA